MIFKEDAYYIFELEWPPLSTGELVVTIDAATNKDRYFIKMPPGTSIPNLKWKKDSYRLRIFAVIQISDVNVKSFFKDFSFYIDASYVNFIDYHQKNEIVGKNHKITPKYIKSLTFQE